MPPEVSIITVYYNTPRELIKLSGSMQQNLKSVPHEWIVADNCSTADLTNDLRADRYLRLEKNYGFARACNIAAKESVAPILFFVNPDCEFTSDILPALIKDVRTGAIAGPKVLNADGTIQVSFGPALSLFREARQRKLVLSEGDPDTQQYLRSKTKALFEPDYVSGCALMISRENFDALNGFDEKFFLYEEDVDLCLRARGKGIRIIYDPSVEIVHFRNRSTSLEPARSGIHYRKSQLYYYRKHHGSLQNLLLRVYLSFRESFRPSSLRWIWSSSSTE